METELSFINLLEYEKYRTYRYILDVSDLYEYLTDPAHSYTIFMYPDEYLQHVFSHYDLMDMTQLKARKFILSRTIPSRITHNMITSMPPGSYLLAIDGISKLYTDKLIIENANVEVGNNLIVEIGI